MSLKRFNDDQATKEEVRNFIYEVINQEALDKMYKGEDVSHIKDAKELIDKAFDTLEEMYAIKLPKETPTNEAK